ncbi:DUF4229 domain-containing protein [Arthrobacter sp. NPDC089319]|uniref:DUF4229 domain-containing protein n=1 Tax=Arthrobacter sp. NPDC089319 TaxID=3155915 RepID=UPI003414BA61
MAFWKFSALRLGIMAVIFVICLFLRLGIVYSALAAAVMGWCITYLFFRKMRDEAGRALASRFNKGVAAPRTSTEISDALAEDSAVEQHGELRVDSDRKPKPAQQQSAPQQPNEPRSEDQQR